ncbi:heparan-alpha-glucosaminide N-acetyltransferase domain-containing protein [Agromyces lapidis]|uniref:Heparan-alpha-glucosaminide N-acetyltransferase domain-containing protein n=1 Tax=Agromyces lapidis TaxID=279574 RepID=A0ABV5SRM7_9MICO|nr:heparan-alpha-glucosaminide N-acetyltransferase domain-containing protein [Agromyces lapidis]
MRDLPAPRVDGIDAARGLALIGMFIAHVAPVAATPEAAELIAIADERPRLLFALTAGFGLGFLTGGIHPVTEGRGVLRRQLTVRAVILIALGLVIAATLHPLVFIILDVYGVAFVVMLPLLFLPARAALAVGAGLLAVTPGVATAAQYSPELMTAKQEGPRLLYDWLLTGAYPVIVWVPVMLIGLGLARLGAANPRVVPCYALAGVLTAVVMLPLTRLLPAEADATAPPAEHAVAASALALGNVGIGLVVVAVMVTLTTLARPAVTRIAGAVLSPVTAMGAMPLTVYTLHLVVISGAKRVEDGFVTDDSWGLTIGLIVGGMVFAWLWRRYLGRGPLERMLRAASRRGRRTPEVPADGYSR